jgi:hypothetical protein
MDYASAFQRLHELAEQYDITESLALKAELDREIDALEAYLFDRTEATD